MYEVNKQASQHYLEVGVLDVGTFVRHVLRQEQVGLLTHIPATWQTVETTDGDKHVHMEGFVNKPLHDKSLPSIS